MLCCSFCFSCFCFFFFFKQKTAYEMRISDWSSDVCSSDLASANLTRVITGLESDLSQPLEGRGVGAMAGEIRSYVHSLPEGQRMGFIQKAIEAGDERTVGAVLDRKSVV